MVIQHNISAINSYRNYNVNSGALSKNLEKLSSGYRINRAADDAAGLAISESMRSKINGLDQATSNAKDAIGMIQTEEGALTEVHSMLQRMTTLATQAANGTYNTTSRDSIQLEMNELGKEINRIATSTDYNGLSPLSPKANANATATNTVSFTMQIGPTAAETITVNGRDMTLNGIMSRAAKYASVYGGTSISDTSANAVATNAGSSNSTDVNAGLQYIQITGGKTDSSYATKNEMAVHNANEVITNIKSAIDEVSNYRADLGAKQNRIEHTINNLQVTSENTTAAESRIRDTDMAKEISAYSKNNVLMQAAQSMLAQANQQPSNVLSLLR